MTYAYVVVLAWLILAWLLLWWATRRGLADAAEPPPAPPPDPITALVDKWAHDWERGRF